MENLYCAWSLLFWDNSNERTFGQPIKHNKNTKRQNSNTKPQTATVHTYKIYVLYKKTNRIQLTITPVQLK